MCILWGDNVLEEAVLGRDVMLGNTHLLGQALRYEADIHPVQPAAEYWGTWEGGSYHFSLKTEANNSNTQRSANSLDPCDI